MRIRRIVVRLDAAPRNRAVREAATVLADKMGAELVGLFVENVDLLHFAGFPFACEVCFSSATRRALDVERMERSLRALADEARRTLGAIVGRTSVRWSFRVARGTVSRELLAAAGDAGLVIALEGAVDEAEHPASVRVVRAGDARALSAVLAEKAQGVLVVVGTDDARIGETLRALAEGA